MNTPDEYGDVCDVCDVCDVVCGEGDVCDVCDVVCGEGEGEGVLQHYALILAWSRQ